MTGGVTAIFVPKLGRLFIDVERLAGLFRADEAVSPLIKSVHRLDVIGFFLTGKMLVDGVQHLSPFGKPRVVDAARQFKILHGEIGIGRIAAQAER